MLPARQAEQHAGAQDVQTPPCKRQSLKSNFRRHQKRNFLFSGIGGKWSRGAPRGGGGGGGEPTNFDKKKFLFFWE